MEGYSKANSTAWQLEEEEEEEEVIRCSLTMSWCVHDNYLAFVLVLIADERG